MPCNGYSYSLLKLRYIGGNDVLNSSGVTNLNSQVYIDATIDVIMISDRYEDSYILVTELD